MVKRGSSSFSASSVAKGSIVLSKAIEKQFALEAEISRLRHHVSVLSKRLHSVTLEKQVLENIVESTMSGEKEPLSEEEVADEEAAPGVAGEELESATGVVAGEELVSATGDVACEELVDATESVAGEEMMSATDDVAGEEEDDKVPEMAEDYNRFAMDLVEEKEPEPPVPAKKPPLSVWTEELQDRCLRAAKEAMKKHRDREMGLVEEVKPTPPPQSDSSRVAELEGRYRVEKKKTDEMRRKVEELEQFVKDSGNTAGEVGRLGSSGDEGAVIGGVIVAGGASTKRKNQARRKKRKLLREEREAEEMKSRW